MHDSIAKGLCFCKGIKEMRTHQTGIGGLQLLLVAATFAALTLVVKPDHEAPAISEKAMIGKVRVAEALNFAGESKRKIAQSFTNGNSLPRTAIEAHAMRPTSASKPEFVRDVKFQPDYAGETVMIMVYLNDGVVENVLGGEQYVYIAGIKSRDGSGTLNWECGARNVDWDLLPGDC
jgi:hypothetical protein